MKKHPDTIHYPGTFDKSPSSGFDGIFDWSFTSGCFGKTKITPMDFDGVVERKGNFLVFETKDIGVPVPKGQQYALEALWRKGCATILFIEGKQHPEYAKVWCQPAFNDGLFMSKHIPVTDIDKLRKFISDWYIHADNNPHAQVDISFLNRRITVLEETLEEARKHIEQLALSLGGRVLSPFLRIRRS